MRDIALEPLSLQDEKAVLFLYETRRHPEICKYLFGKPPQDIESHKNWLQNNIPLKRLMFLLRCDGEYVGYCHAYNFDNDTGSMEVGFVIHPDYQSRGLGHILIRMFLEKISKIMPDRRVQLYVQTDNEKAINLYQRYGFVMKSCSGNTIAMERRENCGIQNQKGDFCL